MEEIEKLEEFNWVSGRDAITIALCNTIIRKQNEIIDYLNSQSQPEKKGITSEEYNKFFNPLVKDTPDEWVCPKCGFDDCYPYKNSEDFRLMYCPACSELVNLNSKKK